MGSRGLPSAELGIEKLAGARFLGVSAFILWEVRPFLEFARDRVEHRFQITTPFPSSPNLWTDSHVLLSAWESGVRTPTPKPTPRVPRARKNCARGRARFFRPRQIGHETNRKFRF